MTQLWLFISIMSTCDYLDYDIIALLDGRCCCLVTYILLHVAVNYSTFVIPIDNWKSILYSRKAVIVLLMRLCDS